ncbi:hypothetical protein K470DRAFT_255138 [Piedraia hortae CBS 480.64]|uniref:Mitochondrial integral membrane protein n=1 Tax=Piedraia hortae CBS 480.64 TaxID=1314780 RepID=A0A6A7C789_9PEZI|nr:hypothetical protein K470DRAFT_255138 [Piedraia hortae CBS 480.64]
MPSLWGSNANTSQPEDDLEDAAVDRRSLDDDQHRQPTERDRLLRPRQPEGFLDPDDPAVSPYNLWSVRALRFLSLLFLAITFVWWVILLVSIFVSPPGLHTRGSGFFDFAYTCLTMGLLLVSLLFFSAPSMAMRVCQGIVAFILLIDLIIIVSVRKIRHEEGPPGIASVIWATLMAAWCVLLDRVVTWGKHEEEERLTGRAETRRTLQEWLKVFCATIILAVYIAIVVLMTGTLIIRTQDATLPMTGDRYSVDGGKYDVHLGCVGNVTTDSKGRRTPTLLLEAGEAPLEYDFEYWAYSAWKNGTIDRYCYWDRPGYGWSDNAPSPHSAGMSADNLAEALAIRGEDGPWILASAGYGSIVSRIFSARHFRDVAGLLLIDPLHEDLLHRLASPSRGFALWGWGVLTPIGIRRLMLALFSGGTREDRVYGPQHRLGGKFVKAQLQESLAAESLTKSEVVSARHIQLQAADTPLVVISSAIHDRSDGEWARKQEDLTKITDHLISWDEVKAPHLVWHELEGRKLMEKRLGQLVKAWKKKN